MLQEFTEDVAARSQAIARQFKSLKVCSLFRYAYMDLVHKVLKQLCESGWGLIY